MQFLKKDKVIKNVMKLTLDTTTVQVPTDVMVYNFRQSDSSEVHTTTATKKDTQNAGASLIDLTINPISCGKDWKSII